MYIGLGWPPKSQALGHGVRIGFGWGSDRVRIGWLRASAQNHVHKGS